MCTKAQCDWSACANHWAPTEAFLNVLNRRSNASNGMFLDILKIGCQCARGKGWIKLNERGKKEDMRWGQRKRKAEKKERRRDAAVCTF